MERPDLLETRAFVDGQWIEADDLMPVSDPATDEVIVEVAKCAPSLADGAVAAAARAFEEWRACLPAERGNLLRGWAGLMRRYIEDLAVLIVIEQGKVLKEARAEIP